MKRLVFVLLLAFCLLICACSETNYKDTKDIEPVFLANEQAFTKAAEAMGAIQENVGIIHKVNEEKEEAYGLDSSYIVVETDGLHIHSKHTMSEKECKSVTSAILALMEEVEIDSVSFSENQLRFTLRDANPFSWDPTIVYCLTDDTDKGRIGLGTDDVLYLKENWYACIIAR